MNYKYIEITRGQAFGLLNNGGIVFVEKATDYFVEIDLESFFTTSKQVRFYKTNKQNKERDSLCDNMDRVIKEINMRLKSHKIQIKEYSEDAIGFFFHHGCLVALDSLKKQLLEGETK